MNTCSEIGQRERNCSSKLYQDHDAKCMQLLGDGGWGGGGQRNLIAAPHLLVGNHLSWKHTIFLMKKSPAGYVLLSSRPNVHGFTHQF